MSGTVDDIVAQRFRIQRLTSEPLPDAADVVRLLTCVQAQDAPLARFSIGMRTLAGDDAVVRHAVDEGRILRTHILRPTWHYVASEDLRWISALTAPKVESGLAYRHRQLGLDTTLVTCTLGELETLLAGRRCLTRRALGAEFRARGSEFSGEQLGHLLMVAELRAIVCSGPLDGQSHTYGLVEELVEPTPPRDRDDAVRDLVARFFAGHGPAAVEDLTRWTRLTKAEVKLALSDLGDTLQTVTLEGTSLWFDPSLDSGEQRPRRAFLLPVFDEAYLSYAKTNLPRAAGHPNETAPHSFSEAGGGVVVLDRRDVGWWKRTNAGRRTVVTLGLATALGRRDRDAIADEAGRLAAFTDRTPEIRFG